MNKRKIAKLCGLAAWFLSFLVLVGCNTQYVYDETNYYTGDTWDLNQSVLNGRDFLEDKSIYEKDEDGSIRYLYLTVKAGMNREMNKEYSFSYLNNYTTGELSEGEEPFCDIIMSEGTQDSSYGLSLFGFGETDPNGQITIKGNTDRIRLRSYQIKLFDRGGTWNDMKTINLYKNRNDLSRMRQKFGFDLLEELPPIGSLRTGFVRLFIQDTTADGPKAYQDMGIYTFIEQPNNAYLAAHELDTNGSLYRAEHFDFSRFPEQLVEKGAPDYSKEAFETILNIRNAENHSKLLNMLDVLHDDSIVFSDLLGRYFNEENLLTFAAVNVLLSNYRLAFEDYLIYSPQNSLTWYLIPSSFEDAMYHKVGQNDQVIPTSFEGYGFLYNNVLYRKYLTEPGNTQKLVQKIEEIREILSDEWIEQQTLTYRKSILQYLFSIPEIMLLPKAATYVEPYIADFSRIVDYNYQAVFANLKKPISPYIVQVEYQEESLEISFLGDDLQSGRVTQFRLELSTTSDFKSILFTSPPTSEHRVQIQELPNTTLYARIVATDQTGATQTSSNLSRDSKGEIYYGCVVLERRGSE